MRSRHERMGDKDCRDGTEQFYILKTRESWKYATKAIPMDGKLLDKYGHLL